MVTFNRGCAAPWETSTIFALMFVGTVLYRAENGQYPWRRLLVVSFVFGVVIVAAFWHISPQVHNIVTTRIGLNALAAAGLTFAVAMRCRKKKVPRALAWPGVVSYPNVRQCAALQAGGEDGRT